MMSSDEDSMSRDSGICELMDENTPVCFSSMSTESTTVQVEECMEIDEDENLQPGPVSRRQKKVTFRREKSSCQVRLFDESPTSHKMFMRPQAPLSVRSENQQLLQQRKRKFEKSEQSSDHFHLEPMSVEAMDDDEIVMMDQNTTKWEPGFRAPNHKKGRLTRSATAFPSLETFEEEEHEEQHHLNVKYHLKTVAKESSKGFRRITAETLRDIFFRLSEKEFDDKYILIDCRYPYEYNRGHIKNAINHFDRVTVSKIFYDENGRKRCNKIPIFYCEFSQARGPKMAYALRQVDRELNVNNYPRCDYEEMYVLDLGYRNFFFAANEANITNLCHPHAYCEMHDKEHTMELKKYNFHNKGQSVLRTVSMSRSFKSLPTGSAFNFVASSASFTSAPSTSTENIDTNDDCQKSRTPAVPRIASRRNLFSDPSHSPTNFAQFPLTCSRETPSPHKHPLTCPRFS